MICPINRRTLSQIFLRDLKACNFTKKRLQHSCFPVKFAKFFKNTFFHRTPLVGAFVLSSFPFKSACLLKISRKTLSNESHVSKTKFEKV